MVFGMALEVFGQLPDPAGEKCDLHVRAAGVFIVELAYFGGMSQREIAATTNTPLGTVKTRLQLGLRKLTQCVRPLRNKI